MSTDKIVSISLDYCTVVFLVLDNASKKKTTNWIFVSINVRTALWRGNPATSTHCVRRKYHVPAGAVTLTTVNRNVKHPRDRSIPYVT